VSQPLLRPFTWSDVGPITAIYSHYVYNSTVTFDLEAPSEAKMAEKFGHMVDEGHPVIVAEVDGAVRGYAYASTFRPRPAYRFTCEDTVYLAPDAIGQGLGSRLMGELITQSQAVGFKQMIGIITGGTEASIALHRKFGFEILGEFPQLGYKFDQWLDIVHMQRAL